jgi:hypothetical protein
LGCYSSKTITFCWWIALIRFPRRNIYYWINNFLFDLLGTFQHQYVKWISCAYHTVNMANIMLERYSLNIIKFREKLVCSLFMFKIAIWSFKFFQQNIYLFMHFPIVDPKEFLKEILINVKLVYSNHICPPST